MINRDMKPYSLQYLKTTEDDYGYPIEEWVEHCMIDVVLNENYKQVADAEGVLYMRRTLQAVTRFDGFRRQPNGIYLDGLSFLDGRNILIDSIKKYRIVGADTFEVVDFIGGRLTQLQLKEVI